MLLSSTLARSPCISQRCVRNTMSSSSFEFFFNTPTSFSFAVSQLCFHSDKSSSGLYSGGDLALALRGVFGGGAVALAACLELLAADRSAVSWLTRALSACCEASALSKASAL